MKRYPKIKYPDDEDVQHLASAGTIVVHEKLDGSNFRFAYDRDGFEFGSRNTEGEDLNRDQFEGPITYVGTHADTDELEALQDEYGPLVFFGEAMIPHTISYDWDRTPEFIGFDVWNETEEVFHTTEQAEAFFERIGLPSAPVVERISADDWDETILDVPQSDYYDGLAEGLVFKNHETGEYSKHVRDEFKEKAKQKFGASKKKDLSDTERAVEEYVTPARIRSVAHQLVDDGRWDTIELPMMEILPEAVIRDMAEEEAGDLIMKESWEIDTAEFRSLVSKRCVAVVNQIVDQRKREELRAGA